MWYISHKCHTYYKFKLFPLNRKQEYLETTGKQWRERKKQTDKYKRFKNGVYSISGHSNNTNSFEYIDPPSQLCLSNQESLSTSNGGSGEIKSLQSKQVSFTNLSLKFCLNNY